MKLLYKPLEEMVAEGLEQIWLYMDRSGAGAGHLIIFDRRKQRSWEEKLFVRERVFDIFLSASLLIFFSPILLLLAILIEIKTAGAFVRQNHRLRFRRAHPIVRRFSLDELPIFIDILLGNDSFFDRQTRQRLLGKD